MKKILLISGLFLILLVFIGCPEDEELPTPNARIASILEQGEGIRLEWDPVEGADGYRVRVDDELKYEGTSTYFEWKTPALKIEVYAYAGDKESTPRVFDFTPVSRTSQELWERSAAGNSGYGWNADGTGSSYSLGDAANHSRIDFYLDDFTAGTVDVSNIYLVSPHHGGFNDTETGFAVETGGTGNIAPAPGTYDTPRPQSPIVSGGTYFLWIDHSNNEWTSDDNFVKIKIISIGNDGKVVFDYWFQKQGGLRWLKTN
ncbi:MAG: hypothetical protein ABDH37_00470 [Candidatus Hydrothermales bacterium]